MLGTSIAFVFSSLQWVFSIATTLLLLLAAVILTLVLLGAGRHYMLERATAEPEAVAAAERVRPRTPQSIVCILNYMSCFCRTRVAQLSHQRTERAW